MILLLYEYFCPVGTTAGCAINKLKLAIKGNTRGGRRGRGASESEARRQPESA